VAGYRNMSVVVLGSFNPAIFHPEWFRRLELLPDVEVEAANAGPDHVLMSGRATMVTFESLTLIVRPERWELRTAQPDWFEDLGAIARSTFDKLRHTPVEAVGLNYVGHFDVPATTTVEALMSRWVPLGALGAVVGEAPTMSGTVRASWSGYTASVTLEPSEKMKRAVFINQNYHGATVRSVDDLLERLDQDWPAFRKRADSVVTTILAG
jgi:hypothetical protein